MLLKDTKLAIFISDWLWKRATVSLLCGVRVYNVSHKDIIYVVNL